MEIAKISKKLFDTKYSKIYLVLFVIATTFRVTGLLVDIIPIIVISKISRHLFIFLYYKAKTNKTNIIINCYILLSVISALTIISNKKNVIFILLITVSRILLCTYLIKIIEWKKLTKNFIKITIPVILLILMLVTTLFYENIDYYIKNSSFGISVLFCEMALFTQLVLAIINILISTEKGNLYLFIATAISAILDGIFSSQNLHNEISPYIFISNSILYSISIFSLIKSSIIRINSEDKTKQ